jgi:hypothetical protein
MDYQARNMLVWSVIHKNFNHILNFKVVIEKTNLSYILYGALVGQ